MSSGKPHFLQPNIDCFHKLRSVCSWDNFETMKAPRTSIVQCSILLLIIAVAAGENLRTRELDSGHSEQREGLETVAKYLAGMTGLLAAWGVINSFFFVPGLEDGVGIGTIDTSD